MSVRKSLMTTTRISAICVAGVISIAAMNSASALGGSTNQMRTSAPMSATQFRNTIRPIVVAAAPAAASAVPTPKQIGRTVVMDLTEHNGNFGRNIVTTVGPSTSTNVLTHDHRTGNATATAGIPPAAALGTIPPASAPASTASSSLPGTGGTNTIHPTIVRDHTVPDGRIVVVNGTTGNPNPYTVTIVHTLSGQEFIARKTEQAPVCLCSGVKDLAKGIYNDIASIF